ncbi:unnamed protein product [Merluccius merluccius]
MVLVTIFLLCSVVSVAEGAKVTPEMDRPFVKKHVSETATLKCCYHTSGSDGLGYDWVVMRLKSNGTLETQTLSVSGPRFTNERFKVTAQHGRWCRTLTVRQLHFTDAGLYRCALNTTGAALIMTHGTFLRVYGVYGAESMNKILNISENTKNHILTVQGVLLLLFVLLPGARLLIKGLRIEDVGTPYDQIQRSQAEVTYEDVYLNNTETEAQLEKP